MNRIKILIAVVLVNFSVNAEDSKPLQIDVYRSPSCGCCSKWINHLKAEGFNLIDHVTNDVQSIKDKNGVPVNMSSCHTALVDGYVVEGHVPVEDIKRMIKLKPEVIGISVPGMPVGTPGMEMGDRKDPYNVIAFGKDNKHQVFSRYEGK